MFAGQKPPTLVPQSRALRSDAQCPQCREHRRYLFDRAILAASFVDVLLKIDRTHGNLTLVYGGLELGLVRQLFLSVNERRFGEITLDIYPRRTHKVRLVAAVLNG